MNIILSISQSAVYDEVAQTTAYTGAKMDGDANAYERIATVDEDRAELQRFWDESRAEVSMAFIRMLSSEGMSDDGDTYSLVLTVSQSFESALLPGMERGLFSFFVQSITSKWYAYTNKKEFDDFAASGKAILDEVRRKAFYKNILSRPSGCDCDGDANPKSLTHEDIIDWEDATGVFLTEHQDLSGLATKEEMDGKADTHHVHVVGDVSDFESALDGNALSILEIDDLCNF